MVWRCLEDRKDKQKQKHKEHLTAALSTEAPNGADQLLLRLIAAHFRDEFQAQFGAVAAERGVSHGANVER